MIGVGARGDLCAQPNLPHLTPIEYNSGLSAISIHLYYYTAAEEKRRMLSIDPDISYERVATSRRTSTRRDNFRADMEERDGRSCVVTGAPHFLCDAVHLLPHVKERRGMRLLVRCYPC